MPYFSRRRIQYSLDNLECAYNKKKELLKNLNSDDPDKFIPTEVELVFVKTIQSVAHCEVEPSLPNSPKKPDVFSSNLFAEPAYIEIKVLSKGKLNNDSLSSNSLVNALKKKEKQLQDVPEGFFKVLFVIDGGSIILRRFNRRDYTRSTCSGSEILENYLDSETKFDLVAVFNLEDFAWSVNCFTKEGKIETPSEVQLILNNLPRPRFRSESIQELQKNLAFSGESNEWYLGTTLLLKENKIIIKTSARNVLTYLSGKSSYEQFLNSISSDGKNWLNHFQEQGNVISGIEFEPGGVDEDDDFIILELTPDPSAQCFK